MLNEFYDDINSFTYDGKNSLDMGIVIEKKENIYGSPAPKIETVTIPGRGTMILNSKTDPLDNEDFEDFGVKYTCFLMPEEYQDVEIIARNIHAWLFHDVAYKRLEDSYERDYYRLAYCGQSVSVEEITRGLLGKLEIELTCKPYKFAYNGERTITLTKAGTLYNTEGFTAKPYMKIYGSGNVTIYINARAHSFAGIQSYIEVDSELMNAYKGDELQNNKMTSTLFPKLAAGQNNISWSGNVTKIEIIPRWCCL